MMRSSLFKVQKTKRLSEARYIVLWNNIARLNALVNELETEHFDQITKNIALHALSMHATRIEKAIDSFLKDAELSQLHKNLTAELYEILNKTKIYIEKLITKKNHDYKKNIVVVGAGPVGYYAALTLVLECQTHTSNVLLIGDNHAGVPIRGGTIERWLLLYFAKLLGLDMNIEGKKRDRYLNSLLNYVVFKKQGELQGELSIKHLDMLGRAAYLTAGGKIVSGQFSWQNAKAQENKLVSLKITADTPGQSDTQLHDVNFILNTMGVHAPYPEGISRQPITEVPNSHIRDRGAQVNINISPDLVGTLIQLRDYYWPVNRGRFAILFFFEGYLFAPYEEAADDPQEGIFYTKSTAESLDYIVRSPRGETIKSTLLFSEYPWLQTTHFNTPQEITRLLFITSKRGHTLYGKRNSEGDYKVQIFPSWTTLESVTLDKMIEEIYGLNHTTDKKNINDKDFRIVLKTFLFIQFLAMKAKIDLPENFVVKLRDMIKDKQLCSEFTIPPPTAPIRKVVKFLDKSISQCTTTWAGAAALPPIINGRFIPAAINHVYSLIQYLLQNNFAAGPLYGTDKYANAVEATFQEWIRQVKERIEDEAKYSQDLSKELEQYLINNIQTRKQEFIKAQNDKSITTALNEEKKLSHTISQNTENKEVSQKQFKEIKTVPTNIAKKVVTGNSETKPAPRVNMPVTKINTQRIPNAKGTQSQSGKSEMLSRVNMPASALEKTATQRISNARITQFQSGKNEAELNINRRAPSTSEKWVPKAK